MKSFVLIFVVIAMPAIASDLENSFLGQVTSAGRNHDFALWQSLHCGPHVISSAEKHAINNFTVARLSTPLNEQNNTTPYELSLCFETKTTKEMCMLLPVLESKGTLCISAQPGAQVGPR